MFQPLQFITMSSTEVFPGNLDNLPPYKLEFIPHVLDGNLDEDQKIIAGWILSQYESNREQIFHLLDTNNDIEKQEVLRILSLGKCLSYSNIRLLGEGTYGKVFEAYIQSLRKWIAIKCVDMFEMLSRSASSPYRIQRESRTLLLNHSRPSLYKGYGSFYSKKNLPGLKGSENQLIIVSERIPGVSYEAFLKQLTEDSQRWQLLSSLAESLSELHAYGLVHRDLKPKNIIVQKTNDRIKASLVDWGAIKIEKGYETDEVFRIICCDQLNSGPRKIPNRSGSKCERVRSRTTPFDTTHTEVDPFGRITDHRAPGSFEYMSPEHMTRKCSSKSDIWALGMIVLESFYGCNPLIKIDEDELMGTLSWCTKKKVIDDPKKNPFIKLIRDNEVLNFLKQNRFIAAVVHKCLDIDPHQRASAKTLANLFDELSRGNIDNEGRLLQMLNS